jgi:hypothetical protein
LTALMETYWYVEEQLILHFTIKPMDYLTLMDGLRFQAILVPCTGLGSTPLLVLMQLMLDHASSRLLRISMLLQIQLVIQEGSLSDTTTRLEKLDT